MAPIGQQRLRVLAIEDNPTDVKLLEHHLSSLPHGYVLNQFDTGEAALLFLENAVATEGQPLPQVILLDLTLPGDHGLAILEKLKAMPVVKDIPVLVFSGSEEKKDVVDAYKHGSVIFIKKSTENLEFEELVNQLRISRLIQ